MGLETVIYSPTELTMKCGLNILINKNTQFKGLEISHWQKKYLWTSKLSIF